MGRNKTEQALDFAERGLKLAQKIGDIGSAEYAKNVIENIKGGTVVASVDSGISSGADSGGGEEIEAWEGLDPGMVRSQVRDTTASLIGLDEDSFFDDTPLMDSGMDSLSSVEFRNQLAKDFQMNLPATLTFDYPSIKSLIQHIVETSKSAPPPEHLRVKSTANKSKKSDAKAAARAGPALVA